MLSVQIEKQEAVKRTEKAPPKKFLSRWEKCLILLYIKTDDYFHYEFGTIAFPQKVSMKEFPCEKIGILTC